MGKISKAFVEGCLSLSDNDRSKLTEEERTMIGDNSSKLRSFLNNICSKDNSYYLELGLYGGSSFIPALFGNLKTKAVGVDNWTFDRREPRKIPPKGFIWDNVKSRFEDNYKRYQQSGTAVIVPENIKIIEEDYTTMNWALQPKFDIINFDILPVTYEAIDALFDKVLRYATATEFVVIINRYSDEMVEAWTDTVLKQYAQLFEVDFKFRRISSSTSDTYNYYSGIGVFGLKKLSIQKTTTPLKEKTTATPAKFTKKGLAPNA